MFEVFQTQEYYLRLVFYNDKFDSEVLAFNTHK